MTSPKRSESSDTTVASSTTNVPSSSSARTLPVLLLGILFHIALIPSIFDIYFTSPVVNVDTYFSARQWSNQQDSPMPFDPNEIENQRPADRVVLIVGKPACDGLRADKLFQLYSDPPFPKIDALPESVSFPEYDTLPTQEDGLVTPAPYIRSLLLGGNSSWGVSHTRVPTESRPGHVALLAGMYEDPSAVLKGWQHNPVNFDSVLNRSTNAWGFGSPDIVPMFEEGAAPGRVSAFCYSSQEEDFTQDAVQVDIWVLHKLEQLFRNSTSEPALASRLKAPGNIFFLHLLGLDTTGHSYRPHGPEYYRNIQVVDRIIWKVQNLFEEYFNDDQRTAYIFTADHGMSARGNHGDGHPDNTRTPLVAWGAGVASSKERVEESEPEDDETQWGKLAQIERRDVEQADVAPLISILAGNAIPGNNAGFLPKPYLGLAQADKAKAALAHALQIVQQYRVKEEHRRKHSIFYQPFPGLSHAELDPQIERLQHYRKAWRYHRLELDAFFLAEKALRGLKYLQRYDWFILRSVVVAGYSGWILYSINFLLSSRIPRTTPRTRQFSRVLQSTTTLLAMGTLIRFAVSRSPSTYYLYLAFAMYFWLMLARDVSNLKYLFGTLLPKNTLLVGVYVAACQAMVHGYVRREIWTAGFLVIGIGWPAYFSMLPKGKEEKRVGTGLLALWAASCALTSSFTMLSVDRESDIRLPILGALLFGIAGSYLAFQATYPKLRLLYSLQTFLVGTGAVAAYGSEWHLSQKLGLPLKYQILGWLTLLASSSTIFISVKHSKTSSDLLSSAVLAFAPTFTILSLSNETLFYFSFAATLLIWLRLETQLATTPSGIMGQGQLNASHVRIALFLLFFIHFGFFGPQNVASIASFYLEPVYRLIPVFNPFAMSALLLYKILIPFFIVAAVFTVLENRLHLPPFALIIVSSIFSDVLVLNFFFMVTDEGSWLEIGQSISHFIIASLLGVFQIVLSAVGHAYIGMRR